LLGSTHIVNTIPPLKISRANLGTAPDQKVRIPSSLKILAAQTKLFLYSFRASIDCILCPVSEASSTQSLSKSPVPGFDGIQGLRDVSIELTPSAEVAWRGDTFGFSASHAHCDESCHSSDAERADRPQLLARCDIPLCELLQGCVTPESGRRIGRLPCRGGHEALEETPYAALSENDGGAVKEAAHTGIRRLAIVDAST